MRVMSSRAQRFVLVAVIVAAAFAAGLTRIADLDFWWHLQTGHLIASTHAIPHVDVFSYTAAGHEYIDHEWLFQLLQYETFAAFGPAGIAILKSLIVALTLVIVALYAVRRGASPVMAGAIVLLSIAGGIARVIERPELFSTLFTALTFIAADIASRDGDKRPLFALPLLYVLWANVHAALVVGLVVQLLFFTAAVIRRNSATVPLLFSLLGSVAASGLNPFGYRVLIVPMQLSRIINSGFVDNQEWRRTTIAAAPFFFVALAVGIALLARSRGGDLARVAIMLFLAAVSLRYVRNVGLFSTMLPLIVAPELASLSRIWRVVIGTTGLVAAAIVLTIGFPFERGFGEASYFPDKLVSFVQQHNVRGRMMNAYGFGGYLIWRLWPQRRVFIDGRNEVHEQLQRRLALARSDSRAWNRVLRDYRIEWAMLQYVDQLDRVIVMDGSGRQRTMLAPLTATRFPRSRWALVDWDDDGMLLIRRNGENAPLAALEYRYVAPEGFGYNQHLVESGAIPRDGAIADLRRKLAEDPSCTRALQLLAEISR